MKKRKLYLIGFAVIALVACTAGPNPMAINQEPLAGFWKGLWHGFIMMFTFIVSLFKDNVSMYEVNNNGNWYNFGFLLGAMMFWGGGGNQTCTRVRSDKGEAIIREVTDEIKEEVISEVAKEIKEEVKKELDKDKEDE